jgi:hypothetical protein
MKYLNKFESFSKRQGKEPQVGDSVILDMEYAPHIIGKLQYVRHIGSGGLRFLRDETSNRKILDFFENNIGKIVKIDICNSLRPSTWFLIKFDKKIPIYNQNLIEVRKWEFKLELNVVTKKYNL